MIKPLRKCRNMETEVSKNKTKTKKETIIQSVWTRTPKLRSESKGGVVK